MRRSSRITLLLGLLLAVVAFVGILLTLRQPATPSNTPTVSTSTPTVFAAADIPLGTRVTKDMVRQADLANNQRSAAAYQDVSLVIGHVIRRSVVKDAQLTTADFTSTGTVSENLEVPAGLRAMSVQVDQVTGVGTIIRAGDYVDVVVGITGDKIPVYTNDQNKAGTVTDQGDFLNNTTVKVLIQGVQVLGVLLPPSNATGAAATTAPGTALTGQQALVIIAVTPQQAEVLKFSQMDATITLLLRSSADFVDASGQKVTPSLAPTTGIILKSLIDRYGVLTPQVVQGVLGTP